MSKEHFWPKWLSEYLPKHPVHSYISEFYSAEGKVPMRLAKKEERQGQVLSKKIRVVCNECNNGWMSQLEEKNKPTLLRILKKECKTISKEEIAHLALWSVVKCIVGEHAVKEMALTPYCDREMIRIKKIIPEYFRVYISRHTSSVKAAYSRHSSTISYNMDGPNPPLPEGIDRNIQLTNFLVGDLYICIFSARLSDGNIDNLFSSKKLFIITPPQEIRYLDLPELSDKELAYVSNHLSRLLSHPRVKYGGPLPNKNII